MCSNIRLFVFCFCCIFNTLLRSQNVVAQNDTIKNIANSVQKMDTSDIDFNLKDFYQKNKDWIKSDMPEQWESSLRSYKGLIAKAKGMKHNKVLIRNPSVLSLNYTFINSDTTQFNEPISLGNISMQHYANVFGVPLSISGSAIFNNQRFDKKQSFLTVQFDYQKHS